MTANINRLYSFRLLAQACAGALAGTLIAMTLAACLLSVGGRPTEMPGDLLSWNLHNVWLKPREKGFYLFSLLFGTIGAYFAAARLWAMPSLVIWLFLAITIPFVSSVANHVLLNNDGFLSLYLMSGAVLFFVYLASSKSLEIVSNKTSPANTGIFNWKNYLFFLTLVTILLIPSSFIHVASRIGMEFHVAGTIIGPALYSLNKHLIPGIDYYSQYSIGLPWIFSFLLGESPERAILNYVIFAIMTTWIFFAQLLWLMHWLYRSWIPAALVTFLFLILLFHGDRHFFDPSSSVLRYPLLIMSAWLLARWAENPLSFARNTTLAAVIACSIFLNTETGIITSIAVCAAALTQGRRFTSALSSMFILGTITLFCLACLMIIAFGPKTFSVEFLNKMLLPLFYFGQYGFGGTPIIWNLNDYNWLYNLVVPGIVLATLGLLIRTNHTELDKPRLAVLVFFAISGLLMMAKFINMSLIAIWLMNCLGFIVVVTWWANTFALKLKHYSILAYLICWATMGYSAYSFTKHINDSRNPALLGLKSWLTYPSLARSFSHKQRKQIVCKDLTCFSDKPSQKDIDLIKQKTKPGEQVAIIDLYDWTYLIGAHRPPLMLFIPSVDIFTKQQLTESMRRLKGAPYLFLVKGKNGAFNFNHQDIINILSPTFRKDYVYDGEGENLVAWKRKIITH
jgi:hypothetical protein